MSATAIRERPTWRAVAVPSEHGGWGLTLEPVLLGLLVAPSVGGALIGLATMLAFLVRTPLKFALVDRRRGRWLDRSTVAARIAGAEFAALVLAGGAAAVVAGWNWLVPVAVAGPFVAVEVWFDARSRGRRLVPELCGAVGVAAASAAIVVAAGHSYRLAAAMWLLLAGRSIVAIPFVRAQIVRLRRNLDQTTASDRAQGIGVLVGAAAMLVDRRAAIGSLVLTVIAVTHAIWIRRPPPVAKVIGLRQMALGFALVLAAAIGTWTIQP